ncbi:MAG: DNA topoisomerase [Clostridiales bacterium]|nr:DNA topoisomerase [Clostridiales bacterium]
MQEKKKTRKKETPDYGNQSISQLKGADRVRKRPAVIFGSDGLEGCQHSVFEIISNSVDEAREGHGSVITVTVYKDHSIEVDDRGRGVPLGWNEKEKRWNWELIFCELYAGGKYNNNANYAAYEYSLGINGLGACATQYSSEWMTVISYDGANSHTINFKKGNADGDLVTAPLPKSKGRTGTTIHWKPDLEVFTEIDVPLDWYVTTLKRQSVVNAGVKFLLRYEVDGGFEEQEFLYEKGIVDYVGELAGENPLTEPVDWKTETKGRDRADKDEYKLKIEVACCFSNTAACIEYYHNSSFLEYGGSPDKAVKSAFVYAIDRYLKSIGKYNKNEGKINFSDIQDCLVLVTNCFSTVTSYENQTKKAITNSFITKAMTDFLKHSLEIYFAENPVEAEKIAAQVLVNKRSREAAESTRLNIRKKLTGSIDIANRVEKFVNCRSKDPAVRELYIVEGDSALTSCKLGRDAEFQAIIPVRGKTLNCLKSSYERIFKSEIITDLLRVVGCGVELDSKVKGDLPKFDLESLRWNKIIICTDADKDGYQIRTLILTMFYRLLPTLIEKGLIYIAESPLYEITCKDQIYFAYNETERNNIVRGFKNAKYTIQRSKGLGENEPEMMWQTTMNPVSRRLIRIMPCDDDDTARMFDIMLGDNIAARREYIFRHGRKFLDDADIFDGDD